ncbi:hypothetical protein Tco_0536713 [Tanacetum coccineum]
MRVSHELRWILGVVYHDLCLGGKALAGRENVGLYLTKSDLCPSFVEELTTKGMGLLVVDSHTGNHTDSLETIRRFLSTTGTRSSRKGGCEFHNADSIEINFFVFPILFYNLLEKEVPLADSRAPWHEPKESLRHRHQASCQRSSAGIYSPTP